MYKLDDNERFAVLRREAVSIIARSDRVRLGSFAVSNIDMLARGLMVVRSKDYPMDMFGDRHTTTLAEWAIRLPRAVLTEAAFWHGGKPYGNTQALVDANRRLCLVYDSPVEYHEYFAHDVWDLAVIERCIAEGVDPEIARSL